MTLTLVMLVQCQGTCLTQRHEVGRTYDWTDADWSPNNVHANRSYINMSHIIEQLLHLTVAHLQIHLTQFIEHYIS